MLIQRNFRAAKTCAARTLSLEAENVSAVALDAEADAIADGVGTATPQERRARVESALSLEPENADLHESLGLWLINEGEFIKVFLGLISGAIWAVVCAPIAFLDRLMFRVELEFLAARGTREVRISFGRRILRFVLLGLSASVYWPFVWWLTRQDGVWGVAGWGVKVLLFGLVGVGVLYMIRESIAESRHRKTLGELSRGEGEE